ncbi:MAG TPA: MerR family transcriptional regulator [Steroidobacteraceae bacterium]|jgi:MerR family mercuric resistance operon transcriptional regulator
MTIAAFARTGGIGVETVRYYQRRGVLPMPQRAGENPGIHRYGVEDLRRLRFVRAAQSAGFTLEQIAELIELDATRDRTRALAVAERQLEVLDAKINDLTLARNALRHLAKDCRSDGRGRCPIIESFERGRPPPLPRTKKAIRKTDRSG